MKEKKIDNRVNDAIAIKDLMSKGGFKVLQRHWERIKENAFNNLIDEKIDKDTILERQKIYIMIGIWINLPASIMKRGENAVEEQEAEKERKDHPIKSWSPFTGHRYTAEK